MKKKSIKRIKKKWFGINKWEDNFNKKYQGFIKKRKKKKSKKIINFQEKASNKSIHVSQSEKENILKIKGKIPFKEEQNIKLTEKRLLNKVQILPKFDKYKFKDQINPKNKIISNGKVYGSFADLDNDKREIYLNLMKNLVNVKNEKFGDKLFAMREVLLKDGIVIDVDIYGVLSLKTQRKTFLGTLRIVGLMIEQAGFIETEMIGWKGENREIASYFDGLTRLQGGQKAYWLVNNMKFDTEFVYITDVQLKLNYS